MRLSILAIFAHPDDESFGVAGALARYAQAGVQVALICVTRGEAGASNGLADTPETLAKIRTAEIRRAAATMGVTDLTLLDWPDGAGANWDLPALTEQMSGLIRKIGPDCVITMDEHGITGHPDHIAVHQAVRAAVVEAPDHLGVRRLFYQVLTCDQTAAAGAADLACVPRDEVDATLQIGPFEAIKRAALAHHRSQAVDTASLLALPAGALSEEHFVVGWAAPGWRPAPGADDLLADLARPLVLASQSPRRSALLSSLGLDFVIDVADVDETPLPDEPPGDLAQRLSRAKANAMARRHPSAVVLAADTVVALGEIVLGKPVDVGDATKMLRKLRNRAHQVHTAVTVAWAGRLLTQLSTSDVTMRAYTDSEIEAYVATGDPLDKAGGYAIQHPEFQPVAQWDGSYTGIMGLPLGLTADLLRAAGLRPTDVAGIPEEVLSYRGERRAGRVTL